MDLPADRRLPHPDRLAPDAPGYDDIIDAHERAMATGEGGYTDPRTGWFVLAATFLWDRGTCCDNGCRHCPYVER